MSDISARLRENADLDEMEHCNPDVVALEREAADTIDQLRTRIAELEAQLERARERVELKNGDIDGYRKMIVELEDELQQVVDYCETLTKRCVDDTAEIGRLEAQQQAKVPDVDALAAFIRKVDGSHRMGAGVLAERICDWWAFDAVAVSPTPKAQEQAEHKLSAAGVFKGAEGLRGLLDAQDFWDQQPYGTRLYFGEMANEYLHRDVLRSAVALLDQRQEQAPQPAEVVANTQDAQPSERDELYAALSSCEEEGQRMQVLLTRIVAEADSNPFNPIGHVIEHVVPEARALAASQPAKEGETE